MIWKALSIYRDYYELLILKMGLLFLEIRGRGQILPSYAPRLLVEPKKNIVCNIDFAVTLDGMCRQFPLPILTLFHDLFTELKKVVENKSYG